VTFVFSTPERYWETKPLMKMGDFDPAEAEYEVSWRVSEANESQTSYSVEQADVIQYQSCSHSDDMFIILKLKED
jgi:hypothetical protein